jgi:hypothetical protein
MDISAARPAVAERGVIERAIDGLATRGRSLNIFFTGLGIVFAAYYWLLLTNNGGAPVDALQYWRADPSNLYPHPELLHENGYNYSPAFELVVGWGRLFAFPTFVAIWRAVLLGALVWLAGPFTIFVLFTVPVASEINAANVQFLLAVAMVVGFRGGAWTGAWAFVLLTKVTPGIGLLWFAVQRRWRDLLIATAVTLVIVAVTFAIWPDRWWGWASLLAEGSPPPLPPYNLPLIPRLLLAALIVVLAGYRGLRWPVIVAGMLALPVFFALSPSILVGILPFVRDELRRRGERRRAAVGERGSRTLRPQGNQVADAIVRM